TTTKVPVWWRWAAPDPGMGPGSEVLRGDARRQVDLVGVGEGVAGERLAAEEPPPAVLQVEPAGARGEGDGGDARMEPQPGLDRSAGMAGEMVADQVEVAVGGGRSELVKEDEVAHGVTRRRGAGHFLPIAYASRAVDPDLLLAAPLVERHFDPVA